MSVTDCSTGPSSLWSGVGGRRNRAGLSMECKFRRPSAGRILQHELVLVSFALTNLPAGYYGDMPFWQVGPASFLLGLCQQPRDAEPTAHAALSITPPRSRRGPWRQDRPRDDPDESGDITRHSPP